MPGSHAFVAHLAERRPRKAQAAGSIPAEGSRGHRPRSADVAQLAARNHATVEVAGSKPVIRSQASEHWDTCHMRIILQTPRLTMRQFTEDDVDNLVDLNSDPAVMRYVGRQAPREVLRDEIIPFHLAVYGRLDRLGIWAAESAGDGEFLGWFHFRPGPDGDITNIDLGYRLRRSTWNRGYATEGSRALINMGFTDLGVQRLFAHTLTVNIASRRVMEKCGLTLVRTTPYQGADAIEGAEHGEVEYALTRSEWQARTAVALASPTGDGDGLARG